MRRSVVNIIEKHRSSGFFFQAGGVQGFALEKGEGEPVVCLHGVPDSSFIYRKLVPALSENGLRGIALDFPGMGFSGRPEKFDYSWHGLAQWVGEAIDALGIDRCHLVLHDTGGPIGFEWVINHPDRVLSLTVLNAVVDVGVYRRPLLMRPFSIPVVGEALLAGMRPPATRLMFRNMGVEDQSAISSAEIDAHFAILKQDDGGRAFLRIMRGFEMTNAKQEFFYAGLANRPYPAQIVWGENDPAIPKPHRLAMQDALKIENPILLPARHYPTEDQAPAIASAVAKLAAR